MTVSHRHNDEYSVTVILTDFVAHRYDVSENRRDGAMVLVCSADMTQCDSRRVDALFCASS